MICYVRVDLRVCLVGPDSVWYQYFKAHYERMGAKDEFNPVNNVEKGESVRTGGAE